MQIKREDIIFLDTNVIIEAKRAGILTALIKYFKNITTVKRCVQELSVGDKLDKDYIPVDIEFITNKMTPKDVTQKEIADLILKLNNEVALDEGERELLAYIYSQQIKVYFICSPDIACVIATEKLGFINQVISLEDLTNVAGIKEPKLRKHFTRKWLSDLKTDIFLGNI